MEYQGSRSKSLNVMVNYKVCYFYFIYSLKNVKGQGHMYGMFEKVYPQGKRLKYQVSRFSS